MVAQLCLGICACAVRNTGWEAAKVLPDLVFYCRKASGEAGHGDFGPRILMLELLTVSSRKWNRPVLLTCKAVEGDAGGCGRHRTRGVVPEQCRQRLSGLRAKRSGFLQAKRTMTGIAEKGNGDFP